MKRKFNEEVVYDYDTIKSAETHMRNMEEKGWIVVARLINGVYQRIMTIDGTTYKYSVTYYRPGKTV